MTECMNSCHDPGDECAEVKKLLLQIDELKKALYAECRGISCGSETCDPGYRHCTGCDARARKAYGPGWGDYTDKRICVHKWQDVEEIVHGADQCKKCFVLRPKGVCDGDSHQIGSGICQTCGLQS